MITIITIITIITMIIMTTTITIITIITIINIFTMITIITIITMVTITIITILSVISLSTNLVRIRRFIIIKPRDEHSRHHILIHVLRFPRHLNVLLPALHHGRLERIRIAHLVLRITAVLSRVLLIRRILDVRWGRLLWMVARRLSLSLRLKLGLVWIIVVVCCGNGKSLSQRSQISAGQHC